MTNALSRTRRDHSLWDRRVNDLWGGHKPVLSPEETLAAARKLWRHATGKAWTGKWEVTSGRCHTWPRRGTFYVNPNRYGGGLRQLVHLIAHYAHRRLHPGDKPHSIRQLRLEAKLTKFAVARWGPQAPAKAAPAAKVEAEAPTKPDKVVLRYRRMKARRDRWADQLDRSQRLLQKAEREVRAYERRHRGRLTV
jgi:hypothetical protein